MEKYLSSLAEASQKIYWASYREGYEDAKLHLARQLRAVRKGTPTAAEEIMEIVNKFILSKPERRQC